MMNLFITLTIGGLVLVNSIPFFHDHHRTCHVLFGIRGGGSDSGGPAGSGHGRGHGYRFNNNRCRWRCDNDNTAATSAASASAAGTPSFCNNPFHSEYDDWAVTHTADYDKADHVIFNTVETVEKAVIHAVEDEVDSIFDKNNCDGRRRLRMINTTRGGGG